MYVDVILPIAIPELFSYRIDSDEMCRLIQIGSIVAVPIGKSKISGAIVMSIHEGESARELKEVLDIIDYDPVISRNQLEFWKWLSSYYICTLGEVYDQFMPSSLKPRTNYLSEDNHTIYKFPKLYGFKDVDFLSLNPTYLSDEMQASLLDKYRRKKSKVKLLTILMEQAAVNQNATNAIAKSSIFNQGITGSTINDLIKDNVVVKEVRKIKVSEQMMPYNRIFNSTDNKTADDVQRGFLSKQTLLLKCSNRDTKYETCARLIDSVMQIGGEVLFISPTIFSALEINNRFSELFTDNLIVYDKRKSKDTQHKNYIRIVENQGALLVCSTRIGVGLPFKNLKLVIVDDEHDSAYQGYEYDLSYNGRDAAIYLAHIHHAKTLLISPVPSIESYHNCMQQKFELVEDGNIFYPKIAIIERSAIARDDYKLYDSSSTRRFISKLLIKEIDERVSRGEITFLYQNRKGFATVVECADCGEYFQCRNCNATLAYHKSSGDLRCRYCSSRYEIPQKCDSCGSTNLRLQGIGTENVEQKISELFPLARVVRLDTEVMENKTEFETALSKINSGMVDIIVGTQLVAKIKEIKRLTLIGVISGDNMFAFPDYRSSERAFQTLSTLAMKLPSDKNSLMVVQMSHRTGITKFLCSNDYNSLYEKEIAERATFLYPPFCKLITFTLRHRDITKVQQMSDALCGALTAVFAKRVSGVVTPQVDKIRGEFIRQIVIKIENGASLARAKDICRSSVKQHVKGVKVSITTT